MTFFFNHRGAFIYIPLDICLKCFLDIECDHIVLCAQRQAFMQNVSLLNVTKCSRSTLKRRYPLYYVLSCSTAVILILAVILQLLVVIMYSV